MKDENVIVGIARSVIVATAVFAVLLPGSATAASMTLDAAVARALEFNADLSAARARLTIGEAARTSAGAYPDPSLILQGEEARGDSPDYEYRVGIEQALPLSGRVGKARAVADAELARERHLVANLELDIAVRVGNAYRAVRVLEEREELSRGLEALNRRLLGVARARFRRGEVSELDVRQFETEAAQRSQAAASLHGRKQAALVGLRVLLGLDHDYVLETDAPPEPLLPPLARLVETSAGRADLLAARSEVLAAQSETRLRNAEFWADPTVALHYRRERGGIGGPSPVSELDDFVGVELRVPLPVGAKGRGAIQAARARLGAGEATERALAARAEGEVRGAYHRVVAQRNALNEIAHAVDASEKAERLAERAYGDGLIGAVQLVLSQQQKFAAESARLDALDEYNGALADLERAAGTLIAPLRGSR